MRRLGTGSTYAQFLDRYHLVLLRELDSTIEPHGYCRSVIVGGQQWVVHL